MENSPALSLSKGIRRNDEPCTAKMGYLIEKKELIKIMDLSLDKTIKRRHAGGKNSSVKTKAQG